MRKLIESKVTDLLLNSNAYGKWLSSHADGADITAHHGVLKSITLITDDMLLSLYTRLMLRDDIVPCLADTDGQYLNVIVSGMYGGMLHDGSIHT